MDRGIVKDIVWEYGRFTCEYLLAAGGWPN